MALLVLLRHGESEWNAEDLFTGWIDVGLSERGVAQAVAAGKEMASGGMLPDVVHTSVQRRAISTADLALEACGRLWVPVRRVKHLDGVSGQASPALTVPNAVPIRYDLTAGGWRVRRGGR